MPSRILVISGDYHFGDNPGIFQRSAFIGHKLFLPLRKTWIDESAEDVAFIFTTHDVETWGNWEGHRVFLNDTEIGRIKDRDNQAGPDEITTIRIQRMEFLRLLGGTDNFTLGIQLEKQLAMPGIADDFVLTRIDTSSSLAVVLGWS